MTAARVGRDHPEIFMKIAEGGVADSPDKLRLFCWGHNQEAARKLYGDAFMDRKIEERRGELGPGPTKKRRRRREG